jgi:hypothetical protein
MYKFINGDALKFYIAIYYANIKIQGIIKILKLSLNL